MDFCRTFDGKTANLLIADVDFIRDAFIKQFDKTIDRRPFLLGGDMDHGLFSVTGDHWRHSRQSLSPAFTSGKLKKVRKIQWLLEKLLKFVIFFCSLQGQGLPNI